MACKNVLRAFRAQVPTLSEVDHCNQETTGAIEAYHKVLKVSTNTLSFPQERFSTVAHAKSVKNFRIQYMTK